MSRFYVITLITIVYFSILNEAQETCKTPDGEPGSCIPVKDCQPITDILSKLKRPYDERTTKFLRDHICGSQGKHTKACCPLRPLIFGRLGRIVVAPPDITKHKNVGLLPKDCGFITIRDKIVHGNLTGLFEFPWMVLLNYQTRTGPAFKCGGSIINERYILTAAHCVKSEYPLLNIRIGEHDLRTTTDCEEHEGEKVCSPPFQDLNIEEKIVHPDYNDVPHRNDVALLRVRKMDFTSNNIKPICLPVGDLNSYDFGKSKMIVSGWGATETAFQSPVLLKAELPLTATDQCQDEYEGLAKISNRQMCAGGQNNTDACTGDSGGPLKVVALRNRDLRYVQFGIVSFGPKHCGSDSLPGVYVNVPYYMDWILDNMKP